MKYPIGIQSFEKIREGGFVYIDKTALVYKLSQEFQYVFLGRPRRFGKSLLLSTIQAYFEGRKELFKGLEIERLTDEWESHPVLHFDLNSGDYGTYGVEEVQKVLNYQLQQYENVYGGIDDTLSNRFLNLIRNAYEKTGKKVVILVDEYDKPLLSVLDNPEMHELVSNALKSFYSCLKTYDAYIRFAMLSGVSKFGKLSIFSDLNNIEDISLSKPFAAACGLTEGELLSYFSTEIDEFAKERNTSKAQMVKDLRLKYDGYRFSTAKTLVYNPFSLLNSIKNRELSDYWFESGTPSFLVRLLKEKDYKLSDLEGVEIDDTALYKIDNVSAIPILYQSGYLTIKDYNPEGRFFTLGYPNQEVQSAFLKYLLPYYSSVSSGDTSLELFRLIHEIKSGQVDAFMTRLKNIFYSIPYSKNKSMKVQEDQVRNLTYLIFKLIGMQIQVECQMSNGRSDVVVWTKDQIYIIELKINSTPEKAIKQIHDKGYAEPYRSDGRPIICIGINYSTTKRSITSWTTAPLA